MSNQLTQAFEARRKAQEALKGLYDSIDLDAGMSAEQVAEEARMVEVIEGAERREMNLARMAQSDAEAAEARAALPVEEAAVKAAPKAGKYDGFRALVNGEARHLDAGYEARDLTAGTATDGAELVHSELLNEIHDLMVANSNIMQLARVLRTSKGNDLLLPRVTTHSTVALVAEAGPVVENQDPQFDQVTIGAFKFGNVVQVSRELEEDSSFNIGQFVTQEGASSMGRGLNAEFVSGAGTTRPTGVDNATTGMTTAAIAAVTFDELIEAQHSLSVPSQRNAAVWIFSSSTIEAIRKLKDGSGNYLWQPSNQAGVASTLLGRPVYEDPNVADLGTGNDFGIYGDMSGFVIRVAGGVSIDRSDHVGFLNDLATYRFIARVDSQIVDTTGIRVLTNA